MADDLIGSYQSQNLLQEHLNSSDLAVLVEAHPEAVEARHEDSLEAEGGEHQEDEVDSVIAVEVRREAEAVSPVGEDSQAAPTPLREAEALAEDEDKSQ